MRRLLLVCGTIAIWCGVVSQTPGLRRPSVRYLQINTDTIRVIYPEGLDATAQRIAHLVTLEARQRPEQAGARLRKIDMLLQNATDISNGYVALAPWRSELLLNPLQNSFELGSLPFQDLLAIHEFRHVQQFSATRKGLSWLMYYLFGEKAYSGTVHLAVPNWFTEGDAVVAETALTRQGRGRLPAFMNGFQEMVSDGKYWPYAKARNGSLKEYIPSRYPLGYLLVNYGRSRYGQAFWDSVMVDAAAYKGLLYSFSNAMKRRIGMNTAEFYNEAMDYYREQWHAPSVPVPVPVPVPASTSPYRDFSYPIFSADGELMAMVETFDQIPAIYAIHGDVLKRLATPGYQTESYFSAGGGKLCWMEQRRHPRWYREDYSVIVVCDTLRHTKRTLTSRSSYFMPGISPDGKQIIAVFKNNYGEAKLHILSAETGEVLNVLPNSGQYYYTYPVWSKDQKSIITAARLPDGRMLLLRQRIADGHLTPLTQPSFAPIGRPYLDNDWVYFAMTAGQTDQIFRAGIENRIVEQVTDGGASKYQPAINPETGQLIYAGYTLQGKRLAQATIDGSTMRSWHPSDQALAQTVVEIGEGDILRDTASMQFASKPYPLMTRPVRLHSWSVYPDDPVYGIELLSQNTLNTLQWRSGWEYNKNSRFHGPFTEVEFGLWYPEIIAGYSATRQNGTIQSIDFRWWQHNYYGGVRIPYRGYAGPYAQFGALTSTVHRVFYTGDIRNLEFSYLGHVLQFTNARKPAYQDPVSRFSQSVILRYSHSIDTTTAEQFHIESNFTFPSPIRNHLFLLEADYRHELLSNFVRFADLFDYARGYDPVSSDEIWRIGLSYQLPVAYPDLGIAGLVYCKRIQLRPFFDYMRAGTSTMRSVGSEVLFDVDLFNVEPVTVGVRWARRLDLDQQNVFSFILPVGF